ncbi:MAG: hybrid sensor histidine kinase/response regulator [Opitutaceae bacterium]
MDSAKPSLPISFEDIVTLAPDAIIVHDLNDVVLAWNQHSEELYGWSSSEIVGREVTKILYLNRKLRTEAIQCLMDQGAWEGELRQTDRNGDEHLVRVRQRLHSDSKGQPQAILSYNTDVTQLRKEEDTKEHTSHVRSSSLLAGAFAHEMNNTLAPIMLSSAMLKRSLEDGKPKEMASMIEKCAQKSAELIAGLLAFEQGKGGGGAIIRKTLIARSIKKVVASVLNDTVELNFCVDDDLWEFQGEIDELTDVFESVMQNAVEAMPEGGKLDIQVSNRMLDQNSVDLALGAKVGPYVVFRFTDDGLGIDEASLKHVAEPFFTTKNPKHGFGFGLAASQATIKGHKGFIVIESTQGSGTSVSVFLPAYISNDDGGNIAPPESKEGEGIIVLIADDEFFVRESIKKALEERGYSVLTAKDGIDALAVYANQPDQIHLVVSNIEMPFMDGPTLCRALKKFNPNVNILVSSGHQHEAKIESIKATGVEHFLSKPYTAEELSDQIQLILKGEKPS